MSQDLSFTGERFLPECAGEIVYEHWHRYAAASRLAAGRRVLDLASGEGYGTALLARKAAFALGVDIAPEAVAHAQSRYARAGACAFALGSCAQVPAASASFDLIVSFETIEHVDAAAQQAMLAEFARLLAPGGMVLLSSPNKAVYSDAKSFRNEFHVRELYREELAQLLQSHFPAQRWLGQKIQSFSAIWPEQRAAAEYEAWELAADGLHAYNGPEPMYYLVAAARKREDLPAFPGLSVFLDRGETLQAANERAQQEVMRLDAEFGNERRHLESLIVERDRALAQRAEHIAHLENLKAQGDQVIVERDAQLVTAREQVAHLENLVAERERIIVERDAQLERIGGLFRAEQEAHGRMVVELRAALQAKADLMSTLSGLEGERTKLVGEVHEFRDRLAETERQGAELRNMVEARDAVILYRQSFLWWLKLPLARIKMALRER